MKSLAARIMIGLSLVLLAFVLLAMLGRRPNGVVRVNKADARLQQAVRQAQAGLDGFVARLSKPSPESRFAIKGTFPTDQGPEYLWVRDPAYRDGIFTGILDQAPIVYRLFKKGDTVRVARSAVVDTLIITGDKREGGFTDEALSGN